MEPDGARSRHIRVPFLGSEARAAGIVNRYQHRTRYQQVYRDVYSPRDAELTAVDKAEAAWLWSRRQGVAVGLSASALHGSRWIGDHEPAELNQASMHGHAGIMLHSDELSDDEVCLIRGIRATTPVRTAFDLGRRKGRTLAVVRVDALLQATQLKLPDVQALIDTHSGARGIVQLREVVDLADYGAESPQETRLRLLFTNHCMRPTHTQIEVFDGRYQVGRIDMGWPEWKVGVQYDGIQHWQDPRQRTKDIDQDVEYRDLGWRMVRIGADLLRYRQPVIIARTRAELRAAGGPY
jgi:very-short-patch-repair endonuclease